MSTLKLSWGTRIAVIYLGFVALIVTLVAGAMRQSFHLVSGNYYEQELKYQEVIDAGRNQSALSAPAQLSIMDKEILIRFPEEFRGMEITGAIQLYSPVDESLDRNIPVSVQGQIAVIARQGLPRTVYTAKLSWKAGGKDYYQETTADLRK